MNLSYDMRLEQTQKLVMTPELIQSIKLLQFNIQELAEYIEEQALTNPVLEVDTNSEESTDLPKESIDFEVSGENEETETDWKEQIEFLRDVGKDDISYRQTKNRDAGTYGFESYAFSETTLVEHLLSQLSELKLSKEEYEIAEYFIESIDDNGYVTVSASETASIFKTTEKKAQKALQIVQSFEPAGVGARDLNECLTLQLQRMGVYDEKFELLLQEHIRDIADNHLVAIAKNIGLTLDEVQIRSDLIKGLEPKPGRQFTSRQIAKYIIPDLILEREDNELAVSLNNESIPMLRVSSYYNKLYEESKNDKELEKYLKEKINSALWIIKSIEQRNNTIIRIATEIVKKQKTFFDVNSKKLVPLTLREIAEAANVHESTVSRCVNGKYIQADNGVFELKFFFSGGITKSGGDSISSRSIKSKIRQMIEAENSKKPLSDQQLAECLEKEGISISRRTVAKYREELGILSSSKRKRF